jgi:diguanylate cyclase (GGDEF)-like protein/PAS domain S-box-containing protein
MRVDQERVVRIEAQVVPGAAGSPVLLADTLPQIVWTADPEGRVTYFNRRWYEYTGLDAEGSLGFAFRQALHPGDEERTVARWERSWRLGEPYEIEYRLFSRSLGAYRWFLARANTVIDESGCILQWSGTCTDIDDQKRFEEEARRHAAELKASRAELAHLVRHDVLTGLPNRVLFTDRLERALAAAERHGRLLAVFFVDLDGFKRINDTLGHDAGDDLLKEIARRLTSVVRSSDTVARLGGDEFVVLVPELERPEDAMALARKLLRHAGAPYDLGAQRVRVTASLGVSVYPDDADGASTLLRHADVAMYRAKQSGKNDARFFAPEMNAAAHERMQIAAQLDGALERGELRLEYQPQWDAATGRPVSFEALLRWTNPTLGDVPPERFVPIAEDNGVIVEICEWVIGQSCERAVQWSRVVGESVRVAANVSLVQLDRQDFVPMVADALARHALDPHQLELELTARIGGHDIDLVRPQMVDLARLGVRLTMDEFGTPGSSIDHVMRLPLHALKIDHRVTQAVGGGTNSERVLEALVSLGQALGLGVVASGIETQVQRCQALSLGCDRLQGFLLSGPLTEHEADGFVASMARAATERG